MKHTRSDYQRIQDPSGLIPDDEPVFLLRGQDVFAPNVLREYAMRARAAGLGEIARLTDIQAKRMDLWQLERTQKAPDLPA